MKLDNDFTEEVASSIQRQYAKEMHGEIQKWEKRPSEERSSWRLIARVAIALIRERGNKRSGLSRGKP